MILEAAPLQVRPGQSEAFEAAFREAQAIISSMPGYRSHELQRCVEREGHYLLLVRWDSVAAHEEGFRKSPQYQRWKQLLHHFYDPFPTVLHYQRVASGPALQFREITAADVPALFVVRPKTRENAMTLEELARLGINPQSITESLRGSTKGWLCEDDGNVVAFTLADRETGEFLVIAVLPEYEGKGIGGKLMVLVRQWLAASGCTRSWLTTDLDTALRAYGFYRKYGWTDWKIERELRWMELDLTTLRT